MGGAFTGGAPSNGGSTSGGSTSGGSTSGGTSSGGASKGGATSGGTASGGASKGGATSGGTASGGTASGGNSSVSCLALQNGHDLASGNYSIQPSGAQAPFMVRCDMDTDGGGWTLAFNANETFDPTGPGSAAAVCYNENCTNLAYSTVLLQTDMMLDVANEAISNENWLARVIVRDVHSASRGRTLKQMLDGPGRFLGEADDNSNLELTVNAAAGCNALPSDFRNIVCGTNVLAFSDVQDNNNCIDARAFNKKFAIGGEVSSTARWFNCAGWPQQAENQGVLVFPRNFRVWVR